MLSAVFSFTGQTAYRLIIARASTAVSGVEMFAVTLTQTLTMPASSTRQCLPAKVLSRV